MGCSSSTVQAEERSGTSWRWRCWCGHAFTRRVSTRRSGETLAEEEVAKAAAALRAAVGEERERSHRLWQRSASGATWARWWERGRVAQGAVPSTGRSRGEGEEVGDGGGGGRRRERASLEQLRGAVVQLYEQRQTSASAVRADL